MDAAVFAALELVSPRFLRFILEGGRLVLLELDTTVFHAFNLEAVLAVQGRNLETNQSAGRHLNRAGGELILLGSHFDFLHILRPRGSKTHGQEGCDDNANDTTFHMAPSF